MTAPESRAAIEDVWLRDWAAYGYGAGGKSPPLDSVLLRSLALELIEARKALTTSAAAVAAMRETLTEVHRCDMNYNVFDCPTGGYMRKKIDAALATPASAQAERMMRLMKAARKRQEHGHNDTCEARLLEGDPMARCSCGQGALDEALRALGEAGET